MVDINIIKTHLAKLPVSAKMMWIYQVDDLMNYQRWGSSEIFSAQITAKGKALGLVS